MIDNIDNSELGIRKILNKLQQSETLSISLLYQLSDLTPDEFGEFCDAWSGMESEKRRIIIRHLADISEESFEVDFYDIFAHCLEDVEPEVRKASLDGLWDTERIPLIVRIIELMESDPDIEVRTLAAATLGHYVVLGEWGFIPQQRVAPIIEALLNQADVLDGHQPLRHAAIESLAASAHPRVEPLIHELYASADLRAQKSALFAMGRTADSRWIDTVIDEMSSPEVDLRIEAARAAGEIGHKSAVSELIELTSDEDFEVRVVAVNALGSIGGDISRRFLLDILDDPDFEDLNEIILEALEEIDLLGGEIDLSLVDF
ncbi:MAG: HEAT repeat domain-containing protein [Candidatus Promineifilaceae bacterium]